MRSLVIGGDGLIGRQLVSMLPGTIWTSRQRGRALMYDLHDSPDFLPDDVNVVFILAAITKAFDCQRDQMATHRINVDAPIRIAHHYKNNAFIVFLSSAAAMYAADTAYGRQKALAEMGLIAVLGYGGVAIVRPGRVTSSNVENCCASIIEIGRNNRFGISEL